MGLHVRAVYQVITNLTTWHIIVSVPTPLMIELFSNDFHSRLTVLDTAIIVVLLAIVAGVLTWIFQTTNDLHP